MTEKKKKKKNIIDVFLDIWYKFKCELTSAIMNPMYYFMECFRYPIYNGELPSLGIIAISTLLVIVTLVIGYRVFKRAEDDFRVLCVVNISSCNTYNHVYNKPMRFTWNERKRMTNIKKHGIDFTDVHRGRNEQEIFFENL